jgi:hypothetical protein
MRHPAGWHVAADYAARHFGSTGGLIMFLYSFMLILLNRKMLPAAIRITPFRTATLVWSTLLFGSLAALTIYTQVQLLFR